MTLFDKTRLHEKPLSTTRQPDFDWMYGDGH